METIIEALIPSFSEAFDLSFEQECDGWLSILGVPNG